MTSPQLQTVTADAVALDRLDALRLLLPPGELADVAAADLGLAADQSAVRLLDTEGVAVAEFTPATAGADSPPGRVTLLSPSSPLPFSALRSLPDQVPDQWVLLGGPPTDEACETLSSLTRRDLVVVTAPLRTDDGGLAPDGASTLRQTQGATAAHVLHLPAAGRDDRVLDLLQGRLSLPAAASRLPHVDRAVAAGHVVLFTGLSGSGKSTLARRLRDDVVENTTTPVTLLDGDVVRHHLSKGLGFSAEDRQTNVRRIGWVAAQIAAHGGIALCSPIAPFAADREAIATMCRERNVGFSLVHVATPLEECERRDRKGLYARARAGEIPDFTGISSPYEEPREPDLRVDTTGRTLEEVHAEVRDMLSKRQALSGEETERG